MRDHPTRVKEIMTADPACCTTGTGLTDVARMMTEHDCGAIPVIDNAARKTPVGVITDRDIVCRAVALGRDPTRLTAGDCMTAATVTVDAEADVAECERLMKEHRVRRVLVTDAAGRCCGIVAQADVATHRPPQEVGEVLQDVSA